MPSYFRFRRVATPKEQQLVSWLGPRSLEQGRTVPRAGGCVAALFLIAVGVHTSGPELGFPENRSGYCLFPSPFCGEHRKEAGTVPRAEKEGDTSRERARLSPRWLPGKEGQDVDRVPVVLLSLRFSRAQVKEG